MKDNATGKGEALPQRPRLNTESIAVTTTSLPNSPTQVGIGIDPDRTE